MRQFCALNHLLPTSTFHFWFSYFSSFSRWSTRSVLSLSSTQYSSLLVQNVFFQFTKFVHFPLFMLWRNCVFWISFLNMCSLYNLCRIALLGCVLGLVFSGLHVRLRTVLSCYCVERRRSKAWSCIILSLVSVACQDDWIASRMKNSAKLQLQLFTQTNESSRHLTQYRCYFRRDISYVVGDSSARDLASAWVW